MVKINWTRQAIEDVHAASEYYRGISAKYADTLIDKIFEKAALLENHPKMGRKVPQFDKENIRELIYKQYHIIYYIVSSQQIDIIAVHYGSKPLSADSIFE
jgi:addiction module RelE/StbE family toxin